VVLPPCGLASATMRQEQPRATGGLAGSEGLQTEADLQRQVWGRSPRVSFLQRGLPGIMSGKDGSVSSSETWDWWGEGIGIPAHAGHMVTPQTVCLVCWIFLCSLGHYGLSLEAHLYPCQAISTSSLSQQFFPCPASTQTLCCPPAWLSRAHLCVLPPVPYLNIGFIHRWGLGGVVEMREERKGGGVLGWVGWEVGL
jgi:hypothetical protein